MYVLLLFLWVFLLFINLKFCLAHRIEQQEGHLPHSHAPQASHSQAQDFRGHQQTPPCIEQQAAKLFPGRDWAAIMFHTLLIGIRELLHLYSIQKASLVASDASNIQYAESPANYSGHVALTWRRRFQILLESKIILLTSKSGWAIHFRISVQ